VYLDLIGRARPGRAGREHRVVGIQLELLQNFLHESQVGRVPDDQIANINLYMSCTTQLIKEKEEFTRLNVPYVRSQLQGLVLPGCQPNLA
jgi:hypothetical protein